MTRHSLKHIQDILLLYERHLAVNLGKLRLTIGAKVLVAEAFYDLEITIKTADHQQLFQNLRALRQGVERTRIHAAGYYEIASSLRSGIHQNGCFNLQEALFVQVTTYLKGHFVSQLQVLPDAGTTQIQVAILHSQVIAAIRLVLNGKRRCYSRIKHVEFRHVNLYLAGRQLGVFRLTLNHLTGYLQHELASQAIGQSQFVTIQRQLRNAVTIAQINKCQATHFADTLYPPGECYRSSCIGESQLTTCNVSVHI